MFTRVLRAGAIAFTGLVLILPAHAAMVEDAASTLARISDTLDEVPGYLSSDEVGQARDALEAAEQLSESYYQAVTAIQKSAEALSPGLGDAWEPTVPLAAALQNTIETELGKLGDGSADVGEIVSTLDETTDGLTEATTYSQTFGRQLLVLRDTTLQGVQTVFTALAAQLSSANTNLTSTPRKYAEARAALVNATGMVNDLAQRAPAITTETGNLGRDMADRWTAAASGITALQAAVEDLQELVVAERGFASALTAVNDNQARLATALNEAFNGATKVQSSFIIICDGSCR